MKRLFVEYKGFDDNLTKGSLCKVVALFEGLDANLKNPEEVFDEIFSDALNGQPMLIERIKESDNVYISTCIIPTFGHGSLGAVLNEIFSRLIQSEITGKNIFFFREYKSILWGGLNKEFIAKCFTENNLYVMNSSTLSWDKINIEEMLEFELDYTIPVEKKTPVKKKGKKSK